MKVICIGDSIMQFNSRLTYPQTGWVQLLDRFFKRSVKIVNFARNGRSTKSFIDEGRFKSALSVCTKGDFALIQFAHNDEKSADPARYTSPEKGGEFRKNLSFFIDEFIKAGTLPLLLTPVARRMFNDDGTAKNSHGDYPQAIIEVAAEKNVPLVDMTKLTMDFLEQNGPEKSRQFYMNFESGLYENFADGKSDNSHLRPEGAFKMCTLFEKGMLSIRDKWPSYSALFDSLVAVSGDDTDGIDIDDEKSMW